MKKQFLPLIILLLASLLLAACNVPSAETTPTIAVADMVATSAAQTVEALTTEMAMQPTNTVEAPPTETPQPTATQGTAAPTNTVPVILQPTNTTVVVAPTQAQVCDKAQFVADVNVPDGTTFKAGETFTKTWRLKNVGTCTWSTSYKLAFDSGNSLEGPATVNLPSSVAPGQTVDVSVNLKAPASNGVYTGYFKLQNASGTKFGVGVAGTEAFWVKVNVGATASGTATAGPSPTPGGSPTATSTIFSVNRVNFKVGNYTEPVTCGTKIDVTADVYTSRAGDMSGYFIVNGAAQARIDKHFDKAEGHSFTTSVEIVSGTTNYEVVFYNEKPNNQGFGPVKFTITCAP